MKSPECSYRFAASLLFVLTLSAISFPTSIAAHDFQNRECSTQENSQQEQQHLSDKHKHPNTIALENDQKYEWEDWNYYHILDLTPSSSLDAKTIRKAYRRQAQLWHPDKLQQTNATNPIEANARFARIALAYEVLSDDLTRREYDKFLKYCDSLLMRHQLRQQQQQQQQQQRHHLFQDRIPRDIVVSVSKKFSKLWSRLSRPLRKLETLLTGAGLRKGGRGSSSPGETPPSQQQHQSNNYNYNDHDQTQPPRRDDQPIRIFDRHQEILLDAFGDEIIRIFQTEEYASTGSDDQDIYYNRYTTGHAGERYHFFQIVSQDFARRFDPYTGQSHLQPITEPQIMEQGYRPSTPSPSSSPQAQQTQSPSSPPIFQTLRSIPFLHSDPDETDFPRQSTLFPGEKLTDNSHLVSPNRRYFAGLSPDCELLIMTDNNDEYLFLEDSLLWNSGSDATGRYQEGATCIAMMDGPYLVVATRASVELPLQIIWRSDVLVENAVDSLLEYPSSYVAKLDNDGSLAVYQIWTPSTTTTAPEEELSLVDRMGVFLYYYWMGVITTKVPSTIGTTSMHGMSHNTVTAYKQCIFCTSGSGCTRLARKFNQLSMEFGFVLAMILARTDAVLDALLDMLWEMGNYLGENSISSVCSQGMSKTVHLLHDMLQFVIQQGASIVEGVR